MTSARPQRQGHPRNAHIALDKGLARHAVTGSKVFRFQMPLFFVFNRIGVFEPALYFAFAGTTKTAPTLKRDAAFFTQ